MRSYYTNYPKKRYLLVAILSAIGGGLFVILFTKAIPRMMLKMMSGMMPKMMKEMKESSCSSGET